MKRNTEEKMLKILDYIRVYAKENGFPPSNREIGSEMDISSTSTVHYYLNMLQDKGYIKKNKSKYRSIEVIDQYGDISNMDTINIPLIGNIAAGEPILAVENFEGIYPMPSELFRHNNELFMLKVIGESMINAGINDGDMIVVNRQTYSDNGDIVVAMIDGSATVKRFFKEENYYRLMPENDTMKDIIASEVDIIGIVVGLVRKY